MPTTPVLLLPYPVGTDPADVPADVKKLADRVEAVRNANGGIAGLDSGGKVAVAQLPSGVWVPFSAIGSANGVAALDASTKVPVAQLPAGAANGVASLGATTKVPVAQLPTATANGVASLDGNTKVPVAQLPSGAASGIASLDVNGKVPIAQMPDQSSTYQPRSEEGAANGYASLDASARVPVAQLPDQSGTYQPRSEEGVAGGYASLDGNAKVPIAQLPIAVTVVVYNGTRADNENFSITAPSAGTYIVEWGAPSAAGGGQGSGVQLSTNVAPQLAKFSDVGMSGGTAVAQVSLTAGQVVTITAHSGSGTVAEYPWAKLTRIS